MCIHIVLESIHSYHISNTLTKFRLFLFYRVFREKCCRQWYCVQTLSLDSSCWQFLFPPTGFLLETSVIMLVCHFQHTLNPDISLFLCFLCAFKAGVFHFVNLLHLLYLELNNNFTFVYIKVKRANT